MYAFAILLLGGLVTAKTVDLVRHVAKGTATNRSGVLLLSMVLGVGYAYLFDYSLFVAWGIGVRTAWVGTVATGLFMAGLAGAWHELLAVMREFAHRYHGEAQEIEARIGRAA